MLTQEDLDKLRQFVQLQWPAATVSIGSSSDQAEVVYRLVFSATDYRYLGLTEEACKFLTGFEELWAHLQSLRWADELETKEKALVGTNGLLPTDGWNPR